MLLSLKKTPFESNTNNHPHVISGATECVQYSKGSMQQKMYAYNYKNCITNQMLKLGKNKTTRCVSNCFYCLSLLYDVAV